MADESRLQRWSRLKRQGGLPEPEPEPDLHPEQRSEAVDAEPPGEAEATLEATPVLNDTDMPPLDSLTASSDVSMFFSQGVSPELRQQALRKLFHQPEFNVRCPLDEYAEDYSQPEILLATTASRLKGWAGEQVKAWVDEQLAPAQADGIIAAPKTLAAADATTAAADLPENDADQGA